MNTGAADNEDLFVAPVFYTVAVWVKSAAEAILAAMRSVARLPILPVWVWCRVRSALNVPEFTSLPTAMYASLKGVPDRTRRLTSSTVNRLSEYG